METAQKRKSLRQSSTCCRDFKTKEQESEVGDVVLGRVLKLIVKDKLLHSGQVPVNVELTKNGSSGDMAL